ncbi:MAG: YfhO family protein [Alistipes sp.]|nr:YfhO family protein [Candidatus Alistipes equi]
MKYTFQWRKYFPHIVSILIFLILSIISFYPQLEGKVLPQHDTTQFEAMSSDIRACRAETGEDPQWTGAMFSGMPAYMINIKYPSMVLKHGMDKILSIVSTPIGFIFFAMLSAYLMIIMMGMGWWAALFTAIAYGLSTYFFLIIGAGHQTKMWALVYAPAMIGAIYMTLRRNMLLGGALTALTAALEIGANHPQITYYFILAAVCLWLNDLVYAILKKRLKDFVKRSSILAAAALLSIGANFSPIYYAMEHSDETIRGGSQLHSDKTGGLDLDYATNWSYGIAESWNMLIPNFMGGSSSQTFSKDGPLAEYFSEVGMKDVAENLPTYWGEQPYTAGPTYLGVIAILLAIIGFTICPKRDIFWLLLVMVFSLVLSWGHNAMWFTQKAFDWLPMYNKFRAVSTILIVLEWEIPLLAGMAIWHIQQHMDSLKEISRKIIYSMSAICVIALFFILFNDKIFSFHQEEDGKMLSEEFYQMFKMGGGEEYIEKDIHLELGWGAAHAMLEERSSLLSHDSLRVILLCVLVTAALLLALKKKRMMGYMLSAIVILATWDLLSVNFRYQPHNAFCLRSKTEITPSQADKEILQDKELGFRVLNLSVSPFNDATTSKFHRSVGGYHGAKLSRYQDLINAYLTSGKEEIYDMLNTKYVISSEGKAIQREGAMGAAWIVSSLYPATCAEEELVALDKIDLKTCAVCSEKDLVKSMSFGEGSHIELVEYQPNKLTYKAHIEEDHTVAVFSEIFYDRGWKAYVDQKPEPYFRANYLLRAMALKKGDHTIVWQFRAPHFAFAEWITLICSIMIIFAIVLIVIRKNDNTLLGR